MSLHVNSIIVPIVLLASSQVVQISLALVPIAEQRENISAQLFAFEKSSSENFLNERDTNNVTIKSIVLTKRLAGGNVANIGDFPWMVILNHLGKFRRVYSCGGTIISSRWILTACHCIKRSPQRFLVVMGEVDKKGINFDFYEGDGLSMIATETIVHPRYRISAKNDIGLLLLPYEITFNAAIQPIRLAEKNSADESYEGQTALIVGWGRFSSLSYGSMQLKSGFLPVISLSLCREYGWTVDSSHLCTAPGAETDACGGDSGGPLAIESNGEYIQIGIVSFGDEDCPSTRAGAFTRVAAFREYIRALTDI